MDSSGYDCPQYVDFASDDFVNWKETASPSALHGVLHMQSECSDSPVFGKLEESELDVNMAEENSHISDDAPESLKALDIQPSCRRLSSDFLVSGSLHEENLILHDTSEYQCHDTPENSEVVQHNSLCGNISNVSSCSSTCFVTEQETPLVFSVHYANLNDQEGDFRKETSKGAISKSFQVENKNCKSQLFQRVEQHKIEKENLDASKSKKRKSDNYIPFAEQVAAFQKKTPKRFHTTKNDFEPVAYWSPPKVVPQSPNLRAAKRRRVVNVLSTEEKEQIEVEEIQKHQFHARPLNSKIFDKPQLPKVASKPSTKPKIINFNTAQRAAEQYKKKKQHEPKYEFHARPAPTFATKGLNQVKSEKEKHLTIPMSPCFALKSREEKWTAMAEKIKEIPKAKTFRANLPPTNVPFTVKHEKKATEIQPFSFDAKDKERYTLKKQKIEEEIEKENTVAPFKAQPVPNHQKFDLPHISKRPSTEPEPFSFEFENRSKKNSSLNSSHREPSFQFKAQPAKVLQMQPFVPEKPVKQLPEIKEFNLHTDIRAVERQHMKELKQIEEEEKERALFLLKQEEEEQEKREILKLRQELVHKANPVRHFKSIEIQPSSRPLTEPLSPKFATEERLLSKH